jgi:hypothetical protein
MKTILLKSTKIGDCKQVNYEIPLEYKKIQLADGIFLQDILLGDLVAKEISDGVYVSVRLHNHFMYEEGVEEK